MVTQGPLRYLLPALFFASISITACGPVGAGASTAVAPRPHVRISTRTTSPRPAAPDLLAFHMVTSSLGWGLTAGSVWRTETSATRWARVGHLLGGMVSWDAPTAQVAWVVCQTDASQPGLVVTWTTDGGVSWTTVHLNTPWPVVTTSLAVSAGGFGSLLASGPVGLPTGPQALWRIDGNQLTTAPVYSTANGNFLAASWQSPLQGWMTTSSDAVPDNTTVLYYTQDGGRQWSPVALPVPSLPGSAASSNARLQPSLQLSTPPLSVPGTSTAMLPGTLLVPVDTKGILTYREFATLYRSSHMTTWSPIWEQAHLALADTRWTSATEGWSLANVPGSARWITATTTTGGVTWGHVNPVPLTSMWHLLDLISTSPTDASLFELTSGGVVVQYRTADSGAQWRRIP